MILVKLLKLIIVTVQIEIELQDILANGFQLHTYSDKQNN